MNRDEAIRLLGTGADGIASWNSYRRINDIFSFNLRGADLRGAYLHGANLRGADLRSAKLAGADLRRADLGRADLSRAQLETARLDGVELQAADLSGADLRGAHLSEAHLRDAVLCGAYFTGADLRRADLRGTDLRDAHLRHLNLHGVNLGGADLRNADLGGADLRDVDLGDADLGDADLTEATIHRTIVCGTNLDCLFGETIFGRLDLTQAIGLGSAGHSAPSTVAVETLELSKGMIPEDFLRGCGLSPWEILSTKLYDPAMTPPQLVEVQYEIFDAWTKGKGMINGCFISYSWKDAKFVNKLHDRLTAEGVNVWLDRHDMVAGPIQDQVWRSIQLHHAVILVMSEDSTRSDWVENELDMARRKEKEEGRPVLCPIALDDAWKRKIDAGEGPGDPSRPLWRTLAQKLVLDFSSWKTKKFDEEFGKLVRGLQLHYGPKAR